LEQLSGEERELLRPGRRRHVQREDPAAQTPGLGACRDASAHRSAEAVAVDRDAALAGAHVACALEQHAERGRGPEAGLRQGDFP
jgi:hypothetical protein